MSSPVGLPNSTRTMALASALVANLISNLSTVASIASSTEWPSTSLASTSLLLMNRSTWHSSLSLPDSESSHLGLGPSLSSLYDSAASVTSDSYSNILRSGSIEHHRLKLPNLPLGDTSILSNSSLSSSSSSSSSLSLPTLSTQTSTINNSSNSNNKYPNSFHPSVHYGNAQNQYNQYNPNQMWPDENWNSWNRVFKLVLLSFVSTIGSMGAIFIISAITVIDTFQIRGNCYLVSLAFGHLLVTILVLPASAIAIMANVTENSEICHFQWILTMACLVVSVLSFMMMAADNYYGMNMLITYQLCCTRFRIFVLLLLIWISAFLFPFFQNQNNFGPEFCKDKRNWKISLDYHPYVLGFLVLFTLITIIYFTRSLFLYKAYKIQLESSSTPKFFLTDGYLLQSNSFVYLISLAMWLPLIVTMVIDPIKPVPQHYLDTVWYIALSNSCCFSYLYAATNRDFREAFNKLFYYCCCKSHVTFARKGLAMRRTIAGPEAPSGLRVHIIPGLNIYAPRKDTGGNSGAGSYGMTSTGHGGIAGGGGFGGSYHHHGQIKSSCDL